MVPATHGSLPITVLDFLNCPISSSYWAWSAIDNYLRFGEGNSFKNPYKPNELSYRHSTSYTNDADVGYVNFSTYLSEVRIWGCFKTPCNDSKNVFVKSIKVVD